MLDDRFYTTVEAAKMLATDTEQVLSWIHGGELIAANVAKNPNGKRPRWRIAESDLAKFLMRRRSVATPTATTKRTSKPVRKEYI